MKVFTTKGLIEIDRLRIVDVVQLEDNCRKILCQYWLGDELVRQSVFIDVLRPIEAQAAHGDLNG